MHLVCFVCIIAASQRITASLRLTASSVTFVGGVPPRIKKKGENKNNGWIRLEEKCIQNYNIGRHIFVFQMPAGTWGFGKRVESKELERKWFASRHITFGVNTFFLLVLSLGMVGVGGFLHVFLLFACYSSSLLSFLLPFCCRGLLSSFLSCGWEWCWKSDHASIDM